MKILIDLDDEVKAAIDNYYSGKIGYIGLENGFKLLEAVKNGTSFSNNDNPSSSTVNDNLADGENKGEEIEVPSAKNGDK